MRLKDLCRLALLGALSVVLSYIKFPLGEHLNLTFSFIAVSLVGYMYGPVVGICYGLVLDPIKFILNPYPPYMPLYTLIEGCAGLLYGMLYKKKITYLRCLGVKLSVNVICNIILTTLVTAYTYKWTLAHLIASLPLRVIKNLVLVPFEAAIMKLILTKGFVK